jgi:hypothetical protein
VCEGNLSGIVVSVTHFHTTQGRCKHVRWQWTHRSSSTMMIGGRISRDGFLAVVHNPIRGAPKYNTGRWEHQIDFAG